MPCYFFGQNVSYGTTTRVRVRVVVAFLSLLVMSGTAYAQQATDNSDRPWHVGVSGNGPTPVKVSPKSAAFPLYDIHNFCLGVIGYCEAEQQAMYERDKDYWRILTKEEREQSNACSGPPDKGGGRNYTKLFNCIDDTHHQYMANAYARSLNEPFHY